VKTYDRARDLPECWDALAGDNWAVHRRVLDAAEGRTRARTSYVLFEDDQGRADSLVVHQRVDDFNLTQYTPLDWKVPANLLHVPVSVARPGYVIGDATRPQVESWIRTLRGWTFLLNWRGDDGCAGTIQATMSPQVVLPIRWKSFDDYLAALRSPYRRRFHKALRLGRNLTFRFLERPREFDETLHRFYLHLNAKSRIRIETLDIGWFRSDVGRILVCEHEGRPLGFAQLVENGSELVWAFVGYDPEHNERFDLYHNLLAAIVRHAIEQGFQTLDMGQTAEEAKLKLGGAYVPLKALGRHSLPWMHLGCRLSMPLIRCRPLPQRFHVFRDGAAP